MKRKATGASFVSSMLSLLALSILLSTPIRAHYASYWSNDSDVNFSENTQQDMVSIYFDKSIYYPDTRVFWEPNYSLPIEIRVVDGDAQDNYVKVNISSSIDNKEVTLTRNVFGVFSVTVSTVGIGLMGDPIPDSNHFNVRYGDEIIAEYFDISSGNMLVANAIFVFPNYIMQTCLHDVDNWESASTYVFDSNGVPMVYYGYYGGFQYNPVTISQYALANYRVYLNTGNTTRREKFLAQAKWLASNAAQKGNYSVWEYNFNGPYGCRKPWVSAMAQGEGLSVLARAYVLTRNVSYINVAEKIILAFQKEMSAGGVRYTDSNGVWFEEYADESASSSKVLNGFMFALTALFEYSFETNNSKGWEFFWEGEETLSNNIYRYDTGSWSYYSLLGREYVSLSYHKIHIEQLRTMYKLTGDQIFLYYSDKFQSYISPPPPPPPPNPKNTIILYTLPSEVIFTVDNITHVTPWSEVYENETSITLTMPKAHTVGNTIYYWNQWSDGNTSRSRTFIMNTNITLTAYYTGPYYELTVASSPITGITFTIDGVPKTTPYIELLLEGAYTLEMPKTYNGYVWSRWLEDGDTNRIKTIILSGTTWTGVFILAPKPPPVGGYAYLIEEHTPAQPITPYLALIVILAIGFTTIKRRIARKTK